jgi:RNA polymerase sigma factor (TIGR02999 family)
MDEVTQILSAIESGEPHAADELIPLVYTELRRLAAYHLANERPGQTLQATALVHEAWLRIENAGPNRWDNRKHFFAAAAEAMRRILVENARRKKAARHGGEHQRAEFNESAIVMEPPVDDGEVLAVHEALDHLAEVNPNAAELVKLRFFVGLTHAEAAELLGLSRTTADRLWLYARAWLYERIQSENK